MMVPSNMGKELAALLEGKRYAGAHARLNRCCAQQLSGEDAQLCLTAALHTTPMLFRKVMDLCAPGEYSGEMRLPLTDEISATVRGTLLVLAAAMNKPEHVRILLAAGYDPNSAGVESAAAFLRMPIHLNSEVAPHDDRCAVSGNSIQFSGKAAWLLQHVTPLAAAVACGSRQAAAVLLRCPDVWRTESGVVCRAAVSALQMFPEDPRQELAALVFGKHRRNAVCARELAQVCDLRIAHSADFCSYELLKTQIIGGFCGEADARRIMELFDGHILYGRHIVRARMRKMELVAKHFPELCRESWVTGLFLRELVRRYAPQRPHARLMQTWKSLCHGEGDLSWAHLELYRMPIAHLQPFLKELSRDIRLIMDADCMGFGKEAKRELMLLLTHVQVQHNRGLEGVSALAKALVQQTDLRYICKAAKLGAFSGDDPKALMDYMERAGRGNLRAVMLTYNDCGKEESEPRWKRESRGAHWHRCWEIGNAAYEDWLQQLADEELSEEECLRRIQVMNYAEPTTCFWRQCDITVELTGHPCRGRVQVAAPEAAICCGTQTRPLQQVLQYMPQKLRKRYRVEFGDRSLLDLEGTPLTLAAATGRSELVRFLLDAGLDADERGSGVVSSLQWFTSDAIPVTPVMAAIYYGEEETARLLLEAGARCDFAKPMCRKLLERGNEQTRELAARLPGVNFESVRPEWLESLKEQEFF